MQNIAPASVLFLLALAGGFLFTYQCHAFTYQAARVEGQRLFVRSCGLGGYPANLVARIPPDC